MPQKQVDPASLWTPVDESTSAWTPVDEGTEQYSNDVANRPGAPKVPISAGLQPDQPQGSLLDRLKANVSAISAPNDSNDSAFERFSHNFVRSSSAPLLHPINTAAGLFKTAATNMPGGINATPENPLYQQAQTYATSPHPIADIAGDVAGSYAGGKVFGAAGEAARPLLENVGDRMQDAGVGIMNKGVLGARLPDMKRGANPGRGYLESDMGPSLSMGSIARKAGAAKEATGGQIGSAIDQATANGTVIPTSEAIKPIAGPLNEAHSIMSGPGGSGAGPVEDLSASFRPAVQQAAQNGGFTPRDLFEVKKNVGQNTSWGDPSQIGLKAVRQRIVGGLSGTLENNVPGLNDLNQSYQDLSSLNKLSNYRANTGQTPLSQATRKGAELLTGGALGYATHNPALAIAPLVLDSVPVKTTLASGLFKAGGALPEAAVPLSRGFGGAGISGRTVNPKTSRKQEQ